MFRVAVVSHVWYKDFPYMQEQLDRLASVYGDVCVIHGGEPLRYAMFLHYWCRNSGAQEVVEAKNVHTYGAGPAGTEQAERLMAAKPAEVWKFETSAGSRRRPDHAIFPEFWMKAAYAGIPCRVFRYPFGGRKAAETDANGFPVQVQVRLWDAARWGHTGRPGALEPYSKTTKGRWQREGRWNGNIRP